LLEFLNSHHRKWHDQFPDHLLSTILKPDSLPRCLQVAPDRKGGRSTLHVTEAAQRLTPVPQALRAFVIKASEACQA